MNRVRDLFVEIGMEIDDDPLDEFDLLINDVKRSLGSLDASGLDEIERSVKETAEEFDDLSREIRQADREVNDLDNNTLDRLNAELASASILANILEDGIEDIAREERKATISTIILGNAFTLTGASGIAMGGGITGALAGIVAILAPVLVLLGGLSASILAAGAGFAAFGAVAIPVMTGLFESADEVAKLEEKIANADTAKERIEAQKELTALYGDMSDAQRGALQELQEFKDFFGDFAKQFENPIFESFGTGLSLVRNILTGLAPTISSVTDVVNELMTEMNNSVVGGGLIEFFVWMESNAADALYNLAHILGNTFGGLFKMFAAFSPVGAEIENGLLSLTARFSEWADSLSSSNGFQQFIDYAMTNGPALMGLLGNLFGIIGDVIVGLAPLGTVVLAGLQMLTGFVSSSVSPLFVELSGWITQLAGAFIENLLPAIMPLAQQWFPILGQAFDNIMLVGQTLVETFISIFPTLQDIFMSIMPVAIELFQNLYGIISSLIQNIVVPLLPKIATVLSEVWSVVKPILDPLKDLISTIGSTIMVLVNNVVGPLIPVISTIISAMWTVVKPILSSVITAFGNIAGAVEIVISAVKNLVSAFANFKMPNWMKSIGSTIGGVINKVRGLDGSHASGLGRVPYDGYVAELHKDEAVLTAEQSNALRDIGVLKGDGSSPQLDLSGNDSGSYKTTYSTSSNSKVNAPVQIYVQGGENPQETARNIKEELEEFFADLMSVMPAPREG